MATIQKWGNSLAVRIPHELAQGMGLSAGKQVTFEKDGNALIVRSAPDTHSPLFTQRALERHAAVQTCKRGLRMARFTTSE